jgi:hypothetical protein
MVEPKSDEQLDAITFEESQSMQQLFQLSYPIIPLLKKHAATSLRYFYPALA